MRVPVISRKPGISRDFFEGGRTTPPLFPCMSRRTFGTLKKGILFSPEKGAKKTPTDSGQSFSSVPGRAHMRGKSRAGHPVRRFSAVSLQ